MMMRNIAALGIGALFIMGACSGKGESDGSGTGGGSETGIDSMTTSASTTDTTESTSTSADGSGSSTASTTTATDGSDGSDGSDGTDGTGNDPGNPLDCGGKIYECGDGEDNDGDGHTDLDDPECTGPCDDDESSFQTGIPGDNVDCKQDCFFDGNSGQGDDKCIWDLKCDPENPGGNIGCEYTGGNNCNNMPPNQDPQCIMFCEQYTPPGCDCFGCCTVTTDEGTIDIFLNGDPDCALDNLQACTECTSQIEECGNPCMPEECEVCFGELEPPEGCDEGECVNDMPCNVTADCPTDYFCYLGCCYPPPPG
jgi:hypothetical protein